MDRVAAVEPPPAPGAPGAAWDDVIRTHGHRVVVSLLALGLRPREAHEIANETWAVLFEKWQRGELAELTFPGLAIRQARFLALDELRRAAREQRRFAGLDAIADVAAPEEPPPFTPEQIAAAHAGLATCSPQAQKIFHMAHGAGTAHADIAAKLGLSTQRVRQILCEVRRKVRDHLALRGNDD